MQPTSFLFWNLSSARAFPLSAHSLVIQFNPIISLGPRELKHSFQDHVVDYNQLR